ncbi:MAG: hypothetical protein FD127_4495, partial [Acidimicrobiaceae bacterium]
DAMTHYTTDTAGGAAVAGTGSDLLSGYAVASGNVGELDTTAKTVDWVGNDIATSLASGTPNVGNFQGASRHREGGLIGGETHVWFWGDDTTTSSTGRLVRCSWTACAILPCTDPDVPGRFALHGNQRFHGDVQGRARGREYGLRVPHPTHLRRLHDAGLQHRHGRA